MELVWKCRFCCETSKDRKTIFIHEKKCEWNKKLKMCFTCEYQGDEGYDYSIPYCEIGLDICDGREKGNCAGWKES